MRFPRRKAAESVWLAGRSAATSEPRRSVRAQVKMAAEKLASGETDLAVP